MSSLVKMLGPQVSFQSLTHVFAFQDAPRRSTRDGLDGVDGYEPDGIQDAAGQLFQPDDEPSNDETQRTGHESK